MWTRAPGIGVPPSGITATELAGPDLAIHSAKLAASLSSHALAVSATLSRPISHPRLLGVSLQTQLCWQRSSAAAGPLQLDHRLALDQPVAALAEVDPVRSTRGAACESVEAGPDLSAGLDEGPDVPGVDEDPSGEREAGRAAPGAARRPAGHRRADRHVYRMR
ncbi:MAG: hypothetical protein HY815_27225 [Candidatus Riflebacteria bacterium]|nr:hypothetical protein [Candidatus Riflebacteria bacterium]